MKKRTAVGAFEAKNSFSKLLRQAGRGAEITIMKHDKPVARLVPVISADAALRKKSVAEIRRLREKYRLDGLAIRELIDEGRR